MVVIGIPSAFMIIMIIPNILGRMLGSISPYNHQPTCFLETARLDRQTGGSSSTTICFGVQTPHKHLGFSESPLYVISHNRYPHLPHKNVPDSCSKIETSAFRRVKWPSLDKSKMQVLRNLGKDWNWQCWGVDNPMPQGTTKLWLQKGNLKKEWWNIICCLFGWHFWGIPLFKHNISLTFHCWSSCSPMFSPTFTACWTKYWWHKFYHIGLSSTCLLISGNYRLMMKYYPLIFP